MELRVWIGGASLLLVAGLGPEFVVAAPIEKTGNCPTLTRSSTYNGQTVSIQAPTWGGTNGDRPSQALLAQGEIQNPLTPQQSINCAVVPSGLKPQIVASELTPGPAGAPLAYLMHFTFDERGRVWAIDSRDYPYTHNSTATTFANPPTGTGRYTSGASRIVILEDTNGDGAMNNFKVFYTGLAIPTSIEVVHGGVIVSVPPYIVFIPNLDGTDVAGTPQVLVSGMGSTGADFDSHGQPNSLTMGLDNWIYGHTGYNGCGGTGVSISGGIRTGSCGNGNIYRFKHTAIGSDTTLFEVIGTGGPANAHGIGQMEDGQWFKSGATCASHSNHQVRQGVDAQSILVGNPSCNTNNAGDGHVYYPVTDDAYYWEGSNTATRGGFRVSTSTATTGHDFYTSRLLPQKYWNRFAFVCDGSTKLCNQDSLVLNGSSWSAIRMPGPARSNIFASTDAWTAPLKARTGPDGGLWVLDWYNYLFLHNPATPATNRAYRHPLRAKSRTRLYRIIPANGATEPVLDLSTANLTELVQTFWNPNFGWRLHAQRLLITRSHTGAEREALLNTLEDILLNNRHVDAVGINGPVLHALWTLEGMKEFRANPARWDPVLRQLLLHPAWTVRRNVPLAMPATAASYASLRDQCAVNDMHAHVRVQALQNLTRIPASGSTIQSLSGLRSDAHITAAYNAAGTGKVTSTSGSVRPGSCPAYHGTTADSTAWPIAVLASPPDAPTGTFGIPGNAQVAVSWTAPLNNGGAPITGYTATASPGGAACQSPNGTTTTCTVTGLANGTAYTFTVTATNVAGTSPPSVSSSAVTPRTVPGAPGNVSGAPGNGNVLVTWTAPASDGGGVITEYVVTASPGEATCQWNGGPLQCTVTGLTNGTAYTFAVVATNVIGSGEPSQGSGSVTPRTTPGAPANVVATPGNAQAVITWDTPASDGGGTITAYTVTASPGGATCQWTEGPLSCTVTGLANGTAHTFTVTATNDAGTGPASNASAPVVPLGPPGAPTSVARVTGDASVTVSWNPPDLDGGSPITGYTVTAAPGGATCQWTEGPLTCIVTGLTNGTAYTFAVTATNIFGTGSPSNPTPPISPRTVPDAPTAVVAVAGNAEATVSWEAPAFNGGAPVTGYIAAAAPGGGSCITTTALSCVITGLIAETAYTFTVRALNSAGLGAPSEPSGTVIPLAPEGAPGPPGTVSGMPGDGSVTVTWNAPDDQGSSPVTEYTVIASPDGATCTTNDPETRTCIVAGLVNGISYTFTVRAGNAAGTGQASPASAAVVPRTVPGAPHSVTGAPGNGNVTISWSPPEDSGGATITSYLVAASPGNAQCTTGGDSTQCDITGLANGTPYTFTVTASNIAGASQPSSPSAPVAPRTLPGAPYGVIAIPGNAQVVVSWTAPASDGGAAITAYTVTTPAGGQTCTWTEGPLSCTVTGLTNGMSYIFTVTAANAAGAGPASVPSVHVIPNARPSVSYGGARTFTQNTGIEEWLPTSTGGPVTEYSAGAALPPGLALNPATGSITGTPTTPAPATAYVIVGTGPGGVDTAFLNITVHPAAPAGLAYSPDTVLFTRDSAIASLVPSVVGSVASWAITPALPAGLAFDTTTGIIAGIPAQATPPTLYTVTASNPGGFATTHVRIEVTIPASIAPRPLVFRVTGRQREYAFRIPAGEPSAEITMTIVDIHGRAVWSATVRPGTHAPTEISWDGRTSTGGHVSAGLYVVHVTQLRDGKRIRHTQRAISLGHGR